MFKCLMGVIYLLLLRNAQPALWNLLTLFCSRLFLCYFHIAYLSIYNIIGLSVVLDIGQYEYIPDVGEAAGAVVVVHDPDDMPFPVDEGILAVPGRLTYVGVRKVRS